MGGPRDSGTDGHAARGGHATRSRRSLLIPALHAVQSRIGWISTPALNYICKRLAVAPAEAYGVATFYALFATNPRPPVVAHICDDIACRLAGAEAICADLTRGVGPAGEPARDGRATWLRSPCLGLCDRAPAAMFTFAGEQPRTFTHAPIDAAGAIAACSNRPAGHVHTFTVRPPPPARRSRASSAGSASSTRRRSTTTAPTAATRPSARRIEMGPERVIAEVTESQADGPRRRGVPDRSQVGRGRRPGRAAPLPRLQRRRIRAGHVQGPRPARGRPVRHGRGDDHRRLRDRRLEGLPLHPRRVPRGRGARGQRHRPCPRGRPPR